VLPERQPFASLYNALNGLREAVCHAPSARGWAAALVGYEALTLRELGYGEGERRPVGDLQEVLAAMDRLGPALERNLLADRHGDVMAARARLRAMLGKIAE
jgi:DNA repair protein RecO (recombination protein O)